MYLNKAFKEKVANVGSKGTKCKKSQSKVTVWKGRWPRKGKPSKTRAKTATSKKESPVVEESNGIFLPTTSSSNDENDKDV